MNDLSNVSIASFSYYNKSLEKQGKDNILPLEIFERVLCYLNNIDIKKTGSISCLYREASITPAKREEFSKIKAFSTFLANHLDEDSYAKERKALFDMGSNTIVLNSVNLMEVKSSIYIERERVVNILKDLKESDLKSLEEFSKDIKPLFFENVFELVKIYMKIPKAHEIPDEILKGCALKDIALEFLKLGQIEKAIEIANIIVCEEYKGIVLQNVSLRLMESEKIEEAIALANTILHVDHNGYTLRRISLTLLEKGDLLKAIEVAKMIIGATFKEWTANDLIRCIKSNIIHS